MPIPRNPCSVKCITITASADVRWGYGYRIPTEKFRIPMSSLDYFSERWHMAVGLIFSATQYAAYKRLGHTSPLTGSIEMRSKSIRFSRELMPVVDSLFFQLVQYLYKLGFDNSPLRFCALPSVRHHRGLFFFCLKI